MRLAHILKSIKSNSLPSHFIFVDTETDSKQVNDTDRLQELRFGWACYTRRYSVDKWSKPEWFRFETQGEFWKWATSHSKQNTSLYIFAHNQSFDFTILRGFSSLRKRGFRLKRAIVESPPTIMKFKKKNRTIIIIDTLNYFRMPLKQLGKAVGLDKKEMPDAEKSIEQWDEYCKRDVEIIYKAMLFFVGIVKDWKLGGFQFTLSSQAFSSFRHRFMKSEIFIDDNEEALKLSRQSYFGGRCECFRLGEINKQLYLLDINSQYPYVMRNNIFPVRLLSIWSNIDNSEFDDLISKYSLSAHVTLKTNIPIYPYIFDKRLVFPIGEFETFLSTPELIEAKARGHLIKIKRVAIYEQEDIFSDFVDYFYDKKLEYIEQGNKQFTFMSKIILVSLYGKFAQSGFKYENIGQGNEDIIRIWKEIEFESNTIHDYRMFAGIIQEKTQDSESFNSFPAISAHVTAYARCYLWFLIETAGKENVFYCDTDSLLLNRLGFDRLRSYIDLYNLGALKVVDTFSYANIRAPKDYIFGDIEKIKGIREFAIKLSEKRFIQDKFPSFKGMIQKRNLDEYFIGSVTKNLTRKYKKGYVNSEGRVSPLKIMEMTN